jgi:hypothetical protein
LAQATAPDGAGGGALLVGAQTVLHYCDLLQVEDLLRTAAALIPETILRWQPVLK